MKPLSFAPVAMDTHFISLIYSSTLAVQWKHKANYAMYSAIAYYSHNRWSHWLG